MEKEIARLLVLQHEIREHDESYEKNKPIISDGAYDKLYRELVALEKKYPEYATSDSPTKKIKAVIVDGLKKVRHTSPMLSQEKIHTQDEVISFYKRVNSLILLQEKLDGLTIVLRYNNGKLQQAVTRGDGEEGQDVTHTIMTSVDVPKSIDHDGYLEVRAEAILSFSEFERINVHGEYQNSRNLVSGTVQQHDATIAAERHIEVIVFDVVKAEGYEWGSDSEAFKELSALGFRMVTSKLVTAEEAVKEIERYENEVRKTLDYAIDGLILKVDNYREREKLGTTSKHPKYSVAFKFESLEETTKLLDIVNTVGKTGMVVQNAVLKPVKIDGSTITKASLHNMDNIFARDIRIGDTVIVTKANDVIPQVIGSVKELRDGSQKPYVAPTNCPSCASKLVRKDALLFCENEDCPAQYARKVQHFISRKAMNIDEFGEKTVEEFMDRGYIKTIDDLYALKNLRSELVTLEGYGERSIDKLLENIEASKKQPLQRLICALSIKGIGERASKEVVKLYQSMDELVEDAKNHETFTQKLKTLDKFGGTLAEAMYAYFNHPKNLGILDSMKQAGVNMTQVAAPPIAASEKLAGMTFVITGELSEPRDVFKKLVEDNGGKESSSVSKKTTYLLMGAGVEGKSKHKKAVDLKIPILSEEEFRNMI